ncbi:MAG TPA: hypothetical protein VMX97_10335 [Hyphomicrobiaceae bacterium]|nr:hypothetical protein [Hyphomicrobiaceae bacterium]
MAEMPIKAITRDGAIRVFPRWTRATPDDARACVMESVVDQCQAARVPVYVKQIRLLNGGPLLTDPADFREHLRIRQLLWTLTTKEGG